MVVLLNLYFFRGSALEKCMNWLHQFGFSLVATRRPTVRWIISLRKKSLQLNFNGLFTIGVISHWGCYHILVHRSVLRICVVVVVLLPSGFYFFFGILFSLLLRLFLACAVDKRASSFLHHFHISLLFFLILFKGIEKTFFFFTFSSHPWSCFSCCCCCCFWRCYLVGALTSFSQKKIVFLSLSSHQILPSSPRAFWMFRWNSLLSSFVASRHINIFKVL